MRGWTHALLEAGRPLFGIRNGKDFEVGYRPEKTTGCAGLKPGKGSAVGCSRLVRVSPTCAS